MPGHSREVIALADAILEVERAEAALAAANASQLKAGWAIADTFMDEFGAYDNAAIARAHAEARRLARGHDNPPAESFDRDSVLSLLNDTAPPVEETRIEPAFEAGDRVRCLDGSDREGVVMGAMCNTPNPIHVKWEGGMWGGYDACELERLAPVRVAPKRAEKVDPCIGSSLPAETNR